MHILEDTSYTVPCVAPGDAGIAWLRASVVRFSEGNAHTRRRRIVDDLLADIDPGALRRPGEPVASLAAALGLAPDPSLVADVAAVSRHYQPHTGTTADADAAVERLVHRCGGLHDEDTAAQICLLVQSHAATSAKIAGHEPPVASTRRIGPEGQEVTVDLATTPFGAGHHQCPGQAHALALVDGSLWFKRLHDGPSPLLLPNAWDVASALAFVQAGFLAVGTTSLGVAASNGLPDAAGAALTETVALARRLARLAVPVTVDIEAGFGADLPQLAAELSALGIAGVNIEDGRTDALEEPDEQSRLIEALKNGAPHLFVNARIDSHWLGIEHESTLDRARRYVDAGADGIFVPGVDDAATICAIASSVEVPLNVLAVLPLSQLADLGVRRVSTGSMLFRAALHAATTTAEAIRNGEAVSTPLPYDAVQNLVVDDTGSDREQDPPAADPDRDASRDRRPRAG